MEKIIVYSEEFENYMNQLIDTLYQQEYFGFKESSITYVMNIYDFIFNNIDLPISKNAPEKFQKFGHKYLEYKVNNRTTWYIFFFQKNDKFLVNYIINNHNQEFPELI